MDKKILVLRSGSKTGLEQLPSIEQFMQDGKSIVRIGKGYCFRSKHDGYDLVMRVNSGGRIDQCGYIHPNGSYQSFSSVSPRIAILIPIKDGKSIIVNNGDTEIPINENGPTLSLMLAARLFNLKQDEAISALRNKSIQIVDFTPDEYRGLTPTQRKLTSEKKIAELKKSPPESGFSLILSGKYQWHRSSTVVLFYKGKTYLIGQDEGTYFGCELVDHPKTVKDAYISLVPKSIRGRKDIKRQGEWFVVPIRANKVPSRDKCLAFTVDTLCLPIDDPDSNEHEINAAEIRITQEGIYARCGDVQHPEHSHILFRDWCTFVKNTAVRSMSQEGVD